MDPILNITALLESRKRQLSQNERTISDAQHRNELLKAEIRAFEAALEALQPIDTNKAATSAVVSATINQTKDRKRDLNSTWKSILLEMSRQYPSGASYAQIVECARRLGFEKNESGLRTSMMIYSNQGLVTRVANGVFAVTAKGIEVSKTNSIPTNSKGANVFE